VSLTLLQKWKLMTAIVRHPEIKAAAVEVAISMLNFLNTKTLQCNPSYQTIADATGLSRDTVMVSVQCLEAVGVLRVSRAVEAGQKANKGQHLPSNSFEFNFEWSGVDQSVPLRSRKIRPPRIQGETKSATTPVYISDHPQSEKPDLGSRKSRPKYGKEETGNIEAGNVIRAAGADVAVTSAQIIYDQGLKYLQKNGIEERQARSILGRWRKDHGDDRTLYALRESHAQHASEPISFITGVLRAGLRQQPIVGSRSASLGIEGA
jgi:biotin operon repressor